MRGRLGVAAPRVAVRAQIPWYLRALGLATAVALSLALGGWAYQAGQGVLGAKAGAASEQEIAGLRAKIAALEAELGALRSTSHTSEGVLHIERGAREQMLRQLRMLEQENGRLKEDLAFFERLAASAPGEARLSISRLQVEPDAVPGQLRYRMLVALHGGKRESEFQGSMQFVVSLQQGGDKARIVIPAAGEPNRQRFGLAFRHFRRVDGTLHVPPGARVTSVEVRLVQDGATRASQTVAL